jgi:hypothetical protein
MLAACKDTRMSVSTHSPQSHSPTEVWVLSSDAPPEALLCCRRLRTRRSRRARIDRGRNECAALRRGHAVQAVDSDVGDLTMRAHQLSVVCRKECRRTVTLPSAECVAGGEDRTSDGCLERYPTFGSPRQKVPYRTVAGRQTGQNVLVASGPPPPSFAIAIGAIIRLVIPSKRIPSSSWNPSPSLRFRHGYRGKRPKRWSGLFASHGCIRCAADRAGCTRPSSPLTSLPLRLASHTSELLL